MIKYRCTVVFNMALLSGFGLCRITGRHVMMTVMRGKQAEQEGKQDTFQCKRFTTEVKTKHKKRVQCIGII